MHRIVRASLYIVHKSNKPLDVDMKEIKIKQIASTPQTPIKVEKEMLEGIGMVMRYVMSP